MPRCALARYRGARRAFAPVEVRMQGRTVRARRSTATPPGDAPTVVGLAGLGHSGRYLVPVGAALADRARVWLPDVPGAGGSDDPARALDIPGLAGFVVDWMDRVALGRVVLVANSMGCQVAVELAGRHPERVSHVVLEGPVVDARARSVPQHAARLALAGLREPPSLGVMQALEWIETGPRLLVSTIRSAFEYRIEDHLAAVGCPAVVVWGTRDALVSRAWADRVAQGLPRGWLQVLDGVGHAACYSHPDRLAAVVEGAMRA